MRGPVADAFCLCRSLTITTLRTIGGLMVFDPTVKKITPAEYLEYAMAVSKNPTVALLNRSDLLVDGDVRVSHSLGGDKIRVLPPAEIAGDLEAKNCLTLGVVECTVFGSADLSGSNVEKFSAARGVAGLFLAVNCKNLTSLSGTFADRVDLSSSGIIHLGNDFSCRGDLVVDNCLSLRSLSCRVGRNLFAERSSLQALEKDFACTGDLHLEHCYHLQNLGAMGTFPRDVYLSQSSVVEISPLFQCGGSLIARGAKKLERLSGKSHSLEVEDAPSLKAVEKLVVASDLSITSCPRLEKLLFYSGGHATLKNCSVDKISSTCSAHSLTVQKCPRILSIDGKWDSDVNLIDLPALEQTSLGFICQGSLLIKSCPSLKKLQGTVEGVVTLSQIASLREVSEDFTVKGNLVLACPDLKLSDISCHVGGDLIVMGCRSEFSTGRGLRVEGSALFHDCKGLLSLSGWVKEKVCIRGGCGLRNIGADFECGSDLLLSDCPELNALNCRVGGDVVVEKSRLQKTGPAFCCEGSLLLREVTGLESLLGTVGGSCSLPYAELVNKEVIIRLSKLVNTPIHPAPPLLRTATTKSGNEPKSSPRSIENS